MSVSQKKSRLLHLDFMRGIFLCVIVVDHLQKFPGFFELFTGQGLLWASAAEGFFFLSGILLGLVRGRRECEKPIALVVKKLWARASLLYIWNILLTLTFTVLAMALVDRAGIKPGYVIPTSTATILREVFTLRYVYGWADFLQYYAVFIFASPLAIWLLRKKLWWLVLIISAIIWAKSGKNYYLSWQLLFFSGAVYGYYVEDLHSRFRRLRPNLQKKIKYITVALAGIIFAVSNLFVIGSIYVGDNPNQTWYRSLPTADIVSWNTKLSPLFDKPSLAIGRLVVFYLWFFALYFIIKKFSWLYEKNRLGRIITTLGQNSLYVYIVHSIILFAVGILWPPRYDFLRNLLINLGVFSLIITMVRKRVFFSIIPR